MNAQSENHELSCASTMNRVAGGQRRMLPLFLMALWIANLAAFFIYFIKLGWTDLH